MRISELTGEWQQPGGAFLHLQGRLNLRADRLGESDTAYETGKRSAGSQGRDLALEQDRPPRHLEIRVGIGTELCRTFVYGWSGLSRTSAVEPTSTILPRVHHSDPVAHCGSPPTGRGDEQIGEVEAS